VPKGPKGPKRPAESLMALPSLEPTYFWVCNKCASIRASRVDSSRNLGPLVR